MIFDINTLTSKYTEMHLGYGKLEISDFYVYFEKNYAVQSYNSVYIVLTVVEKTNIKIVRTLMMKIVEENLDSYHQNKSKGIKFVAFNNSDINSNKPDSLSIRCCCGWELCFSIMDCVSDRFLIQKNATFSSMTVSLRSGAFPNFQTSKCIALFFSRRFVYRDR